MLKSEFTFNIRVSDCDNKGAARFSALWNLMQEAATLHATQIGMSRESMLQRGVFWVISRARGRVFRVPKCHEEIKIQTETCGTHKLLHAMRSYTLRGSNGEIIAEGLSAWALLDVENNKIQRPNLFFEEIYNTPYEGEPIGKIPPITEANKTFAQSKIIPKHISSYNETQPLPPFIVKYTDIDMNNHVNNTRYIAWVEDALGVTPAEMEVNYLAQTSCGDTLHAVQDGNVIELRNENEAVFRGLIK